MAISLKLVKKLAKEINKIDPDFAEALNSNEAQEIIKASPWAWLEHELDRVTDSEQSRYGHHKMRIADAFKFILHFKRGEVGLGNLIRDTGLKSSKREYFFYDRESKIKVRYLLEYHLQQFRGSKILVHLCETNESYTSSELARAINAPSYHATNIIRWSPFLKESINIEKTSGKLSIKQDFYNKIYLPMKPWLTEEGCKIFRKWRKLYNQ